MAEKKELLISALKATYKKLCDAAEPIAYIRDNQRVERIFVEGNIEFFDTRWKPLQSHHDLFGQPETRTKRRLLIGSPGFGKSLLTLQYAYDWLHGVKQSCMKDVEIVLLLRLRQLGKVSSLYQAVKRFLLPPRIHISESEIENVLQSCESLVVLFDGFDEYPDADNDFETFVMKIITSQELQKFEVVVTSRYSPKRIPRETQHFRLLGFNDKARLEFIKRAVEDGDTLADKIMKEMKASPILCHLLDVPLIFVMYVHMAHGDKIRKEFKTATAFFRCMIGCFHFHMKVKMSEPNVQVYDLLMDDHCDLDKVAFKALNRKDQQHLFKKQYLVECLGYEFYENYRRIGILVEEDELFDSESATASLTSFQDEIEVRFYHKIICEWYAAHYLSKLAVVQSLHRFKQTVSCMDPSDLQYCYMFACGIQTDAVKNIWAHLKELEGGEQLATLCILEQQECFSDIQEIAADLCSRPQIFDRFDDKNIHRPTIDFLRIASSHEISIAEICLNNAFGNVDVSRSDYLYLKSGVGIPVLSTLEKLTIIETGRNISSEELTGILKFSGKCLNLKKIEFVRCLLPYFLQMQFSSPFRTQNIEVRWCGDFVLDVTSGFWTYKGCMVPRDKYQEKVKSYTATYGQ